jgi:glyoxylase-like metal-dependent hydrolase (beta-lactamase superfamily II)
MLIACLSVMRRAGLVLTLLFLSLPASAQLAAGSMPVKWNEGAEDCQKNPQPPLQVHPYNSQTFILRENPCATYEAPFMYLLLGSRRALLIDTGAVADPHAMPLAQTVQSLVQRAGLPARSLLVVHTHGHLDHRAGDGQFVALPGAEVVGTKLKDVTHRFQFNDWPNGVVQVELGSRTVDVIPTPGHYPSEVSYYDRSTGLFFSGDFLLPGRLLIADAAADLASARRVAQFIAPRPVSYVLGGHIELDRAGHTFLGDHNHPNERPLQLTKQDLMDLPAIVASFNGFYGRSGDYVLENQNRVLMALGTVVIALLVAAGFGLRAYVHRNRRAAR